MSRWHEAIDERFILRPEMRIERGDRPSHCSSVRGPAIAALTTCCCRSQASRSRRRVVPCTWRAAPVSRRCASIRPPFGFHDALVFPPPATSGAEGPLR